MSEMLRRAEFNLRKLAGLTGIPLPTVKHWSSGRREPPPDVLPAIARAFRTHADTLRAAADALDPPASPSPPSPEPVKPGGKQGRKMRGG